MAEVAVRSRRDAETNPNAQLTGSKDVDELLAEPYLADPLRRHDCAPITDGAAVIVLAADDRARELDRAPGLDHRHRPRRRLRPPRRPRPHHLPVDGRRRAAPPASTASRSPSCTRRSPTRNCCCGPSSGLGDDVRITPSGGALAGNPMFAAGLVRIGEAAAQISSGAAGRVLAHATSGPALQHNLVCVMEGRE